MMESKEATDKPTMFGRIFIDGDWIANGYIFVKAEKVTTDYPIMDKLKPSHERLIPVGFDRETEILTLDGFVDAWRFKCDDCTIDVNRSFALAVIECHPELVIAKYDPEFKMIYFFDDGGTGLIGGVMRLHAPEDDVE